MLLKSIFIGLVSVFRILDSRVFGRLNFERPLITCTIVGLILGDVKTGLLVGAQMEMITLGMVEVGASSINMNMGAMTGCALVITSGASIETALTVALPMTLLDKLLDSVTAIILINFCHICDRYVDEGNYRAAKRMNILYGPIIYSIQAFIPVFAAVYLGNDFIKGILSIIPEYIISGISLGANIISFFGFAMLLSTMVNKKNVVFFLLGFFITAFSNMSLTRIAIISIITAVILYQLKYSDNGITGEDDVDELSDQKL